MRPDVNNQAETYTREHRKKRRWRKVMTFLASVVVFCTTYALILPAITMEEAFCGITEHVHTEACYTQADPVEEKQLVCTVDPSDYHEHSEECYDTEGNLICGLEEKPQHVHTEECYEVVEVPSDTEILTCGMQEHTHTKACYADPTIDMETPQTWEQTMQDSPLTGEWRNDLLAVAQTQLGYRESQKNYIVLEDGATTRGYTRYGAWDGNPYEEWCASFVSFCLHYADVPEDQFPQDNNCVTWMQTLQEKAYDLYQSAATENEDGMTETYMPTPGDLVFFTWDQNDSADHIGIVSEVIPADEEEPAKIITIEGNKSDEVAYHTYELGSEEILGYGTLPQQDFTCGKEGHVHTDDCYGADEELTCTIEEHIHTDVCEELPGDEETEEQAENVSLKKLTWEGADFKVRVSYGEDAGLPENTELQVREIENGTAEYEEYLQQTEKTLETESEEKVRFARFFDITFTADGKEVEPQAPVSVSITYEKAVDLSDPGNSQVIHFSENGPELLYAEAEQLQDDSTRFTHVQDSFSVVGDLVTVAADHNAADNGPDSLPVDYYVCIDGEWTCVGSTKTGWYAPEGATEWKDSDRDLITVEQVESILGSYGFNARTENPARKIAYKIKVSNTKIYSDTTAVNFERAGNRYCIPLSRYTGNPGYDVFYLPANTDTVSGVTSSDELDKAANAFYTVKVYDENGSLLDSGVVPTGGNYTYSGNKTINNWIASFGDGRVEEIPGNAISLTNITSPVTVSPKQGNVVDKSVTYKVMIDGQWQTVGTSSYYYSGTVNDSKRAYITSDMAAQFFGSYGFNASEGPGKSIGYSYNDIYKIYYASNIGYCMDIDGNQIENNTAVQLWTTNTSTAQIFRIWDAGDGYSYITPVENSAYHLNVLGGGTTDGTKLGIHTATDVASHWKVVANSDGTTSFFNRNAPESAVIDLPDGNVTKGNQLQIWSNGGYRYWKLVQQYRISNISNVKQVGDVLWKIGLTEESNGDIVCYYLPAEADDWLSLEYKAESEISNDNSFWSVSVRDDTHSVYSDGELNSMTQIVKQNGKATVTVRNADGILWSVAGATAENITSTQSDGYTTFVISNITQPIKVAATKANPQFTVQYYANIDQYVKDPDNGQLEVIDTSGKKLPTNSNTQSLLKLSLEETSTKTDQNAGNETPLYCVKTEKKLTQMYTDGTYNFEQHPGLAYFDKLWEKSNYKLDAVLVLKDGKSADSMNDDDWWWYKINQTTWNNITFTNIASEEKAPRQEGVKQSANSEYCILLQEGTIIRLRYETNNQTYTNQAYFHDYDITSGQNADGTWNSGITGINHTDNYVPNRKNNWKFNGTQNAGAAADTFAFGNANCETGLGLAQWGGNNINAYNGQNFWMSNNKQEKYGNNVYKGCTFGLVKGLDENRNLIWDQWITVPHLFNDGTANGKHTYNNGSLQFSQTGDTYTLSAANSTVGTRDKLEYFFHPSPSTSTTHTHIFTNNYWPMDSATNKTDPLMGAINSSRTCDVMVNGFWDEQNTVGGAHNSVRVPISDDGRAHNWFFGMNFSLSFTLTEDYTGPLEYLFFGDDDMWVFLDNQLICDIGGVHSSVGEYVNLRDYLPIGEYGQHTLTFYYTERGASGSTCWMSFTLPSVTSATAGRDIGSLQICKAVNGIGNADFSSENYRFKVELLTSENGSGLNQTFSFRRSDDTYGTIKNGETITLHADESVTINGIPAGSFYRVTELTTEGYHTAVNDNEGYIAAGTISNGVTNSASFVNTLMTYELPETGGSGTDLYIIGGLLLIATAGILLIYNQRKRRKEDHTLS